jgi:hypothetical protein
VQPADLRRLLGRRLRPADRFETDDYAAVQGFVAAGVGVSLIAELGLTTIRDDIVVRDLGRETPVRRIYAATLTGGYRTPATAAMLEVLNTLPSDTSRDGRDSSSSAEARPQAAWSAVVEEPVAGGEGRCLHAVGDAQLAEQSRDVDLHRVVAHGQTLRDLRMPRPCVKSASTEVRGWRGGVGSRRSVRLRRGVPPHGVEHGTGHPGRRTLSPRPLRPGCPATISVSGASLSR